MEIGIQTTLTRQQLVELEQKKTGKWHNVKTTCIAGLPIISCLLACGEYWFVTNKYPNMHQERYLILLLIGLAYYLVRLLWAIKAYNNGNKLLYKNICHGAPLYSSIYVFLTIVDFLTLKTGILLQPFIPWANDIINAAVNDYSNLFISTLFTLRLLFMGYFAGVITGLITGVACGYSARIRYWLSPIIKVLGPIPTATWIPLIMILISSLFAGSLFIVALGTWFAVTVATMTGISNIDKAYYDAAKTLGANNRQLIWHVAIPHAMPSIFQGMTQGMSSACISLMIAEMIGVEAGLGWYITWAKAWAAYNKMFAAIVIICLTFNGVTKILDIVKKRVLRWQTGVVN